MSFEKTFEEIINEMERETTVSGCGIAGNIVIADAIVVAPLQLQYGFYIYYYCSAVIFLLIRSG